MSIEGESLLLQIKALIEKASKNSVASEDNITKISYFFDRPDIDIRNNLEVLGIISLTMNSNNIPKYLEDKILSTLSNQNFINKVIDIKGSNSIKDDIEQSFIDIIDPKLKKPSLPKHSKKQPETKEISQPFRDIRGRFYSLANLQSLINYSLHDQIKKNMGKGNAKSILNYRTGRFANSAKIVKITRTRDNAIEVLYDYLKYPYQTFEPGFKQGNPESRDPKLLISKSIREIAKQTVSSRLKAILV